MNEMKRIERINNTLRFKQPDKPPHFEIQFQLTEEAFGLLFPENAVFEKVDGNERKTLFEYTADIYARIVKEFDWDAVTVIPPFVPLPYTGQSHPGYDFIPYLKNYLRERFDEQIPVGGIMWGSVISIDIIKDYMEFSVQLFEERSQVEEWAEKLYTQGLSHAKAMLDAGADFIVIASDHAFNAGTMLSPVDFASLVTPYMKKLTQYIQSRGAWVVMHSDGNLMRIMDQIIEISPDVLQSVDPMAGMDIAAVKKITYGKVALMGNVNCSFLQDGPIEKIRESARYCLKHGAPGGGYIFSSSNTIFDGVPLTHYKEMLSCLHNNGKQL